MRKLDVLVSRLADLLDYRIRSIATPHLFEATCAWKLEETCHNFILGAEHASFDAGLVIADDCKLPQDLTERFFYALDHLANRRVILPVEIKTIFGRSGARWRGPTIAYRLEFKQSQEEYGIVIITNPVRPDLVAVVPRPLLRKTSVDQRFFDWEAEYVSGQEPQPFPVPLAPLVMPIDFLPQALQAGADWCKNPAAGWRNPYNGITFSNLPRPVLRKPAVLLTSEDNSLNDIDTERFLYEALKDQSREYRLQRLYIKPCISDFAIAHLATRTTINIEVKHNMVMAQGSDVIVHTSCMNGGGLPHRIFSPFNQWDFLLTINTKSSRAWLLPIDAIPQNWFTDDITGREPHSWCAGSAFLQEHCIRWNLKRPKQVTQDIERVLNKYLSSQPGLARANIRQWDLKILIERPYLIDQALGDDADSYKPHGFQFKRNQERGTQDMWTPRLSEARWAWHIRQQCISEKFGALYPLGKKHPSAEFAFAFGAWNQPPPFVCLPEATQVVLVNFAFVSAGDARTVTDHRRPEQLILATEGLHPSIYILVPYEEQLEGRGLNVHAVPTTLMKSDPARNKMNKTVNNSVDRWRALNSKHCMDINLAPGHHVEGFLASEGGLVKVFKRLYQKLAGIPDADCEPVLDIAGVAGLDPASLVTTKQVALQQTVDAFLKRRALGRSRASASKKKSGKGQDDEDDETDEADNDNEYDEMDTDGSVYHNE